LEGKHEADVIQAAS